MISQSINDQLCAHAVNMRETALRIAYACGDNAHLGGGLSIIDAMAVLYGSVMNAADLKLPYEERDKFILSKGHGVLGLYSALFEFGLIDEEKLKQQEEEERKAKEKEEKIRNLMNDASQEGMKERTQDLDVYDDYNGTHYYNYDEKCW